MLEAIAPPADQSSPQLYLSPLWHNRCWEVLTIIWGDCQTSKPHCHQISFSLTRIQPGRILERKYRKYRTSGGKLMVAFARVLTAGQWTGRS